jgi:hypothetical protein
LINSWNGSWQWHSSCKYVLFNATAASVRDIKLFSYFFGLFNKFFFRYRCMCF